MKRSIVISLVATMILVINGAASAGPQLPDPQGWDVSFNYSNQNLADDFQCTQTGAISDIHFWVSWQGDMVGSITDIYASIYSNNSGKPGSPLWQSGDLTSSKFTMKYAGAGNQSWDTPQTGSSYILNDHTKYYQVNIESITNPFVQTAGTTYWLDIALWMSGGQVGWKTTLNPWGSRAVYYISDWPDIAVGANDLPVDLAFVITPEPATIALFGLGALGLLRKRSA